MTVKRFRADCGSCSEEIVEEVGKHCMTFYIRANCLFLISLDTFLLSILLYYTPFMVNNKGKVWRNGKKVVSLHEKLQV